MQGTGTGSENFAASGRCSSSFVSNGEGKEPYFLELLSRAPELMFRSRTFNRLFPHTTHSVFDDSHRFRHSHR